MFFDRRYFEAWSCRKFLDHADDISAGVCGKELAKNVDVILIEADFVDVNGKALFEPLECFKDCLDDVGFQDRFSELDGNLDVIVALGDVVIPTPEVCVDLGHRLPL